MSQVKSISISQLNNGDFYQFIENIVTIVTQEPLASGVIATLVADQPILLDSFKKEVLTLETQQIVALDKKRDRAYLKFKTLVEGYAFDDETPENMEASGKLQTFIKQHGAGKLVSFDYNKETASISSLVLDITTHAGDALATLGLDGTLSFLKSCNDEFKSFYAARGDAASILVNVPPFYKLRKEVAVHYRTFASDLESLQRFIPASATVIGNLITRVNVEIDKFRLLVPSSPEEQEPEPMPEV
jgi:hypothetical protein